MPPALSQPTQRKMVLDDTPAVVLATIEQARQHLPGHDEDDILALIEEGAIPWCWNIALNPRNMARELRILPDCINHYQATAGARDFTKTFPNLATLEHVLAHLLHGDDKPFLRSTTIRFLLNCGGQHIINLIDAGILIEMPGTSYKRGPTGAAAIRRASFLRFLQTRAEGAL